MDLGTATISPRRAVEAGAYTTLTFTYAAGHPIDDTGFVKLAFRYVSDFGAPQFDRPSEPNYCSVTTTGDCRIEPRWDSKGHTRPWGRALYLKIMGGFLDRGERIVVVFGDTSHGSPGWRMQTFCERSFELKTFVDPIATVLFKELPRSPALRIVPSAPVRARCVAPSQVRTGQPLRYTLIVEDRWGNPVGRPRSRTHPGFARPGTRRTRATDKRTGLSAESNPVRITDAPPRLNHYWADLHGQSEETIGTNTIDDYFTFARDYGVLDASAHQGNDFQVTDDFWGTVNRTTKRFYQPGRFVTFPGYEWSGNTPLGGDRNVYFEREGGAIRHSSTDLLPGSPDAYRVATTAAALFEDLARPGGPRPFAYAHVGGRYADLAMHDDVLEPAVEVHSSWGTFEWLVEEALKRGYRIGICANSDGHKGRPGASYPGASRFGCLGGLTCILAPRLDRSSIAKAIRARRFYATTGNRPLIDVRVHAEDGRIATMGDVLEDVDGSVELVGSIAATAGIETVCVRNGLRDAATLRPYGESELGDRIKITWSGAEVRGRDRMTVWDGDLQLRGNRIRSVKPVNFLRPDQQPEGKGSNRAAWKSVTTGGACGLILALDRAYAGTLRVKTAQGEFECPVRDIGLEPRAWEYGGLRKRATVYRLPSRQAPRSFTFRSPIRRRRQGPDAIYIRVEQEDGHVAWTSPVYLTRTG